MRAALAAALHHSRDVGPGTNDAPRGQTAARVTMEPELFQLYEEELGGTRPDRLSDVRPQERVQVHTVEHLTDLVRFAPMVQVLDAPVPLMSEQLVDVLALLEKQEKEEEARMDLLEIMILEEKSASAADKEAWRRWARAGGTKRKRKKRRKRKLPRCPPPQASLRHAARVPAVQVRDHEGASVPVHRQSVLAIPEVTQRRGTHSANRADLRRVSTGAVLGAMLVLSCVVQRQGLRSRQRRKPWSFCRCSSWTRLRRARRALTTGVLVQTVQKTFAAVLGQGCGVPVAPDSAENRGISTGVHFLGMVVSCPLWCKTGAWCAALQKTVEVPQLRLVVVVVDIPVATQRQLPVWGFTAVNVQRQVPAVLGVQAVRKSMESAQLHAGESSF